MLNKQSAESIANEARRYFILCKVWREVNEFYVNKETLPVKFRNLIKKKKENYFSQYS